MNKKHRHQSHRLSSRITLLMVPNNSGQIRQVTYPAWLPKFLFLGLAGTIILLVASTAYLSDKLQDTRQALIQEKISVAQLQIDNENYLEEVAYLKDQFLSIDDRLAMLTELEGKVLHMVGLESDELEEGVPADKPGNLPTSNEPFAQQTILVSRSTDFRGPLSTTDHVTIDMSYLQDLIEYQTVAMTQLVTDVENQLEYLDAQPNLWPATGRITSRYGYRTSPTNRSRTEFHQGIDIADVSGTSIVAAGSGIVTYSGYNGGYGRMIIISHGYGYTSVYAHNNQNLVEVGDRVKKGDVIGTMGRTGRATGPHLHFEIRIHGNAIDPLEIVQEQ